MTDLCAAEFRKQWSHKPMPIPPNVSGLWYSEECADQMLTDFAARVSAADKAELERALHSNDLKWMAVANQNALEREEWAKRAEQAESDLQALRERIRELEGK